VVLGSKTDMNEKLRLAEDVGSDAFPVELSDNAIETALTSLTDMDPDDGQILRISINGGGCAGLKYALNFVNEVGFGDLTCTKNGLKVSIDIFSACHLSGAKVDFVESIDGAGFKFDNPNAKRTCGCGSSFQG